MGKKWAIFIGDCGEVGEVLASKPNTPSWIMLKFLDAFFRTYGQVVFCNNPVTGFLILTALIISGPLAAGVGVVAVVVAIVTAWLVDQPPENLRAGICSYNALLVGQLSAVLLQGVTDIDWLFIIVGAALSVYFTSAFGTLFQHISKYPLPAFTVPFVLAQILVYMCATSPSVKNLRSVSSGSIANGTVDGLECFYNLNWTSSEPEDCNNSTDVLRLEENITDITHEIMNYSVTLTRNVTSVEEDIPTLRQKNSTEFVRDWGEVCTGMLRSLAQVYGQNKLPSSLLMLVAVVVSSPTTACMGLLGAIISTLVGVLLGEANAATYAALYAGEWGFNGFLAAAGVGGFALVITPQSAALAVVAAMLAALFQSALAPAFTAGNVPLTTLPFNLSALLLLCASARGEGSLVRPPAISFPEKHRRDWVKARRANSRSQSRSLSVQIPPTIPEIRVSSGEDEEKKEQLRRSELV